MYGCTLMKQRLLLVHGVHCHGTHTTLHLTFKTDTVHIWDTGQFRALAATTQIGGGAQVRSWVHARRWHTVHQHAPGVEQCM